MRISGTSLFAAFCAALAGACGGGGGDATTEPPAAMEYAARDAAFEGLASRLEDAEPTGELPASGAADYTGFLGATVTRPGGAALFLSAEARLSARFAEGTVSGGFSRFMAAGGADVPGQATLSAGRIGPAGIRAEVSGGVTAGGEDLGIDGTFSGTFLGSAADSAAGVVDAAVTSGGAPAGELTGEVWLER